MPPVSPDSRTAIRDEKWFIRRIVSPTDGGGLNSCDSISDLVRGHAPRFLTQLAELSEVIELVNSGPAPDTNHSYTATALYPESPRLSGVANDGRIHRRHPTQQFALAGARQRSHLRKNQSQKRAQRGLSFLR
jgi:hypothetical protein